MKNLLKPCLLVVLAAVSGSSLAFPELPFCPAGGPTGWMNYFDYKRDQNNWRRYSQFQSPYQTPYYYTPQQNNSPYLQPGPYPRTPYTARPFSQNSRY